MYVQLNAISPTNSGTLTCTISLDLVAKGGDPSGVGSGPNTYRGYRC